MDYYVVAHPDDENEGIGAAFALSRSNSYIVFIVATAGENSAACPSTSSSWVEPGENPPPHGYDSNCIVSRRESMLRAVGGLAGVSPSFDTRSGLVDRGAFSGGSIYSGSKSAVAFYNYGDGNLTSSEVNAAISLTRQQRGHTLPSLAEGAIIAGSFTNGDRGGPVIHPNCSEYQHSDHYAVQSAIFNTNAGLVRWGTTCISDPDGTMSYNVSSNDWNTIMKPTSGIYPVNYGWMLDGSWPYPSTQRQASGHGNGFSFSAEQRFWSRP